MVGNSNPIQPPMQPAQQVAQTPNPTPNPVTPQQTSNEQNSSSSILAYLGIAVFVILILVMGGYILFSRNKTQNNAITTNQQSQKTAQNKIMSPAPTNAIAPVTAANSDQTLSNTDTNMQQSFDQMNTDLNDLNNVDTTQDNPNNL